MFLPLDGQKESRMSGYGFFLLKHVNRKFFLFNNMYLFVSYEIITTFAPQNFLLINIKQRFMNNYETVFILTPVLSDAQMKEAVEKFTNLLKAQGAEIVNEENWGLRKLAYPIDKKTTGFYQLVEFKADPSVIATLELNFRRDERVIRFLTSVKTSMPQNMQLREEI